MMKRNLMGEYADRMLLEQAEELVTIAQARLQPRDDGPHVDLARTITDMSMGRVHGEDRTALEEYARRAGVPFDPQRIFVPFGELARALTAGTAGAGGFLVSTQAQNAVDILRPWSVTVRAGVVVEAGLVGDQTVPVVGAKSTPTWLSTEGTAVTASQPALGAIGMMPKTVGILCTFSRKLALQANGERFVRRELLRTAGNAVDIAVLRGAGGAEPVGLLNTPNLQTQSGTSLNGGTLTMKRKIAEVSANDERIVFLSTPAIRELLEGRERAASTGRFVWERDTVADRAAFVSTDMPTATMLCGDFSNVYLGVWGDGFTIEINPYDSSAFKAGSIQARILLSCDVAVLQPTAFALATSIT